MVIIITINRRYITILHFYDDVTKLVDVSIIKGIRYFWKEKYIRVLIRKKVT